MSIISDIWNHPANRQSRMAALLRAIHWQCYKRMTGRPVDLPYHGLKLRCYPDGHSASRAIYFGGLPDYREMQFMLAYLRPGDQVIDVGANVGLYTLLALSVVGSGGHVHAFEPGTFAAKRLHESLQLNHLSNATIHPVALSDANGEVAFVATEDDCTAHIVGPETTAVEDVRVPTARLDDYLPEAPYAMAKLDIEGHEPFALRGASSWLEHGNPPVLLIEMAGYSKRYGISTGQFIEELDSQGYYTAIYDPATRSVCPTSRPWEIPVENVLAICRAREDIVLDRLLRSE